MSMPYFISYTTEIRFIENILLLIQVSPFDKKDEADKKKLEFATGNSDHLTMVNAYKVCVSVNVFVASMYQTYL